MKTNILTKAAAFFLFLYSLAGAAVADETKKKEEDKPKVSVSEQYTSDYFARPGFHPAEESMQTNVALSYKNVTAFYWENRSVEDEEVDEINAGVVGKVPITDKITGRISFQEWLYPRADARDHIAEAGLHYSGPFEADLTISRILPGSDAEEGTMAHGTLATKPWKPLKKVPISLTALAQSAYNDNFYDADGVGHLTPGGAIEYKRKNFSAKLTVKHQDGKNGMPDGWQGAVGIQLIFN